MDHEFLLQKLEFYRLRGVSNDFLGSYLKQRSQYVSIENVDSKLEPIRCVVPQGSVLGPLLFNLVRCKCNFRVEIEYIIFIFDVFHQAYNA